MLIHKRRKEKNYFFKKDEIEYAIIARLHRMFKQMLFKWPDDLKLWMSHAQFCIKYHKKIQLSKLCTNLLQMHGHKPQMWTLAARWEIESGCSIEKGRALFMKGVKLHPHDKKLWLEFFRAELLYADKLGRELKVATSTDADELDNTQIRIINADIARIAYRNAIASIPDDALFHAQFLNIAAVFLTTSSFAMSFVNEIQENIKKAHGDDPGAQAEVAKLHLNPNYGLACGHARDENLQIRCDEKCWKEFEKAVCCMNSVEMWGEYFDCVMSMHEEKIIKTVLGASDENLARLRLNQAYNVAIKSHSCKKLSVDRYPKLVEFMLNQGRCEQAYQILTDVCEYESDPELLLRKLDVALLASTEENLNQLFKGTATHVEDMNMNQQRRFLTMWIHHAIANNDEEIVKAIVSDFSIGCDNEAISEIQNLYLGWISVKQGVKKAFQVFLSELCGVRTPSIGQFKNMLHLLKSSPDLRGDVEQCFEHALREHGSDHPELWLQYVEYCQQSGGFERIGKIYWRAKRSLQPQLTEKFITGFSLFGSVNDE